MNYLIHMCPHPNLGRTWYQLWRQRKCPWPLKEELGKYALPSASFGKQQDVNGKMMVTKRWAKRHIRLAQAHGAGVFDAQVSSCPSPNPKQALQGGALAFGAGHVWSNRFGWLQNWT